MYTQKYVFLGNVIFFSSKFSKIVHLMAFKAKIKPQRVFLPQNLSTILTY